MEQDSLRRAFGQFATGVTIITAEQHGTIYGMTVNSFTSLSLDPPLLLWCLGRGETAASSYDLFNSVEKFSVSILNEAQEAFSRSNAQHDQHELSQEALQEGLFVKDALVGFSCRTEDKIVAGDHLIIIGAIEECKIFKEETKPLIFYQKQYRTLG